MPKGKPGLTKISRTCEWCGAQFETTTANPQKRTCSKECAYALKGAARSLRVTKVCKTCGKEYEVKRDEADRSNYCSKECLYARNSTVTSRPCAVCGAMFRTPPSQMHVRTCSTECGYKLPTHSPGKEKVECKCAHCGGVFYTHGSHAERRIYCSRECQFTSETFKALKSGLVSGDKNPSWKGGRTRKVVSASGKVYSRGPAHVENEKGCRRQRVKGRATPTWADIDRIREVYMAAQWLTSITGIVHHVDHIVPLTSDLVCGLHVENNLQVLPGPENLRKHNRAWHDMP